MAIAWAITDASPGSGTVTANWDGNVNNIRITVTEIAHGFNHAAPIAQHDFTVDTSPGISTTGDLASVPDDDSMLLSCYIGYEDGGLPAEPDSGWTEMHETSTNGIAFNTQYVAGSNGTQYGGSNTTTAPDDVSIVGAIEVQQDPNSFRSSIGAMDFMSGNIGAFSTQEPPVAGGGSVPVIRHHREIARA